MEFLAARTHERSPAPNSRSEAIHLGLRELRPLRVAAGNSPVRVKATANKNDGRGA